MVTSSSTVKTTLVFEFLQALKIMVVSAQFLPSHSVTVENPLRDLLYIDSGLTSPNPANTLELDGSVICSIAFVFIRLCRLELRPPHSHTFSSLEVDLKLAGGHPYSWVQELCGLGFLPGLTQPQHRHIGDVIDAIRKRADSLVSLKSQVDHLR